MEISIAVGYLYCAIVFKKKKGGADIFLDLLTNISLLLPILKRA
jgi:hypothetical protein